VWQDRRSRSRCRAVGSSAAAPRGSSMPSHSTGRGQHRARDCRSLRSIPDPASPRADVDALLPRSAGADRARHSEQITPCRWLIPLARSASAYAPPASSCPARRQAGVFEFHCGKPPPAAESRTTARSIRLPHRRLPAATDLGCHLGAGYPARFLRR